MYETKLWLTATSGTSCSRTATSIRRASVAKASTYHHSCDMVLGWFCTGKNSEVTRRALVCSRSSKPGEILNLHMSDPLASIRPWEVWRRGAPKKVLLAAVQESVAG